MFSFKSIYTFNKIPSNPNRNFLGSEWNKFIGQNKIGGEVMEYSLQKKALKWRTLPRHKIAIMQLMMFQNWKHRSITFSIIFLLGKHPSPFFICSFSSQMGNLDNETNSCRSEISNDGVYLVSGKQRAGMLLQTNEKCTYQFDYY